MKNKPLSLLEIAKIIQTDSVIKTDRAIEYLLIDSRSLSFPLETLFFAFKTKRNDGHNYIQDLYNKGVRAFVVTEILSSFSILEEADFLLVDDSLAALQTLVATFRKSFNLPVIGITGSNGKTVIKEWLYQMLQDDLSIVRSPRSYNSQIGVPLSVWQLTPQTDLAIFEAGISMMNEMEKLEPIIQPSIGIFTNIGAAHQENFQTKTDTIKEKLKLFTHVDILIFNSDYKEINKEIKASGIVCKLLNWGTDSDTYLQVLNINKKEKETVLIVSKQNVKFTFYIPFIDDASIENALHCITYMLYAQYDKQTINAKLQKLEPVAMRLEVKQGLRNTLLINDSYNSDINSLGIALDFLAQQAMSKQLSKTLILSDIMESGVEAAVLYAKVADLLQAKNISKFIAIGPKLMANQNLFKNIENHFYTDTASFLNEAIVSSLEQEAILIKGSRSFSFEEISQGLEFTAHETVLEVNLTNLIDNLNYFRSKLQPETKIMCMVKAFAYGSGSVEIAKVLQHHKVDYLAVAVADEGAELRRAGIHIPIVVMNPEKSAFDILIENNLEPEIYSFDLLRDFMQVIEKYALKNYPIHIKIDSGMHRLGFDPNEIDNLLEVLQTTDLMRIRSVFSHLAAADTPNLDSFTEEQVTVYQAAADKLQDVFPHKIYMHILNSAGVERFPQHQMDMVRLGIGQYGISALPNVNLQPVNSLKTIVLQVKNVKAGETVGYNRNGFLNEDKEIAVLPIGYADGFNRKLGNGVGNVYIKGQLAPVVGNVSMDLISVDVTGLQVHAGDIAEIFGYHIRIEDLAKKLDTIPYEILTAISRRVKRLYYQE